MKRPLVIVLYTVVFTDAFLRIFLFFHYIGEDLYVIDHLLQTYYMFIVVPTERFDLSPQVQDCWISFLNFFI